MRPRFVGSRSSPRVVGGASSTQRYRAAKSRARLNGKDLVRVDLSRIVSKYASQTERNLRRILDAAERSQAVLFFDEAEDLLGRRAPPKSATDRYAAARDSLISGARRRRITLLRGNNAKPRVAGSAETTEESDA